MKKLLLIAAAFLSLSAQARQLTFYLGDTPLKPDEKVEFTNITREDAGTGIDVVMAPPLYLHSDIVTSNVTIVADCTSGQSIQMCAGGSCMAGPKVTKSGIRIGTNEKINLEFEYLTYVENEKDIPDVVTTFTAVDPKYPNTEVKMTLEMKANAGTATVTISSIELAIVDGGLKYKVEGPSSLNLIDITGRTVMRRDINGEGLIDTSSLPRGLYIYRLSGLSNLSGKLYLR